MRLITLLALALILMACGSPSMVPSEITVQAALSTPTLEPTFTPSKPPPTTPIARPTDTTIPEPTPTPESRAGLSGRILDQDTNQPITGAQVSVGDLTTTTNANGRYTLTGLEPGQYVLSVIHPDYDPGLSSIFTLVGGQDRLLDLTLYPPDTSPYPQDPMLTNPLDPNGAPTKEDAERLAREQGLTGEVVNIEETHLSGEYLVNYKISDDIRAAVAELNHEAWELTDDAGRMWWIIKVCGNLASPLPQEAPIVTPVPHPLPPLAEVLIDGLVVRTCASEDCTEVGTVPRGSQVEVFGCLAKGGDWCEVGWTSGRGWCTEQSLRQLAVAEAVPMVEVVLPTATLGAVETAGKLAFVSSRDGNWQIYMMNADGSGQMRLTNPPARSEDPAWSPDGQRLAFTTRTGVGSLSEISEISVMNADGSNLTNLTDHSFCNSCDHSPAWSPDGQQIAFLRGREIYIMNTDGSGQMSLTNDRGNGNPAWSPDGQLIAFSDEKVLDLEVGVKVVGGGMEYYHHIYAINVDGSGLVQLTNNPDDPVLAPNGLPASDDNPVWSPDGQKIAFVSNRDGNWEIYVIDVENHGLTRLTNTPADERDPTWSPNGQQIAFSSGDRDSWDIYVMNSDGSGLTQLTFDGNSWDSTWSR